MSSDLHRPPGHAPLRVGYYHEVLLHGGPVRRAWHRHKFQRVIAALPSGPGLSILDIGCSAGSFLSLLDEERFSQQVGVDIDADQIAYAHEHFSAEFRRFVPIPSVQALTTSAGVARAGGYDCITLIEVIEHLEHGEVRALLQAASELLKPGGTLVVTTPNYASAWPALEWVVSWVSEVAYTEHHVTRFTYFDMARKLDRLGLGATDLTLAHTTTSHFVSPFLAALSPVVADKVARWAAPSQWRFPFGNLVIATFRKGARAP